MVPVLFCDGNLPQVILGVLKSESIQRKTNLGEVWQDVYFWDYSSGYHVRSCCHREQFLVSCFVWLGLRCLFSPLFSKETRHLTLNVL